MTETATAPVATEMVRRLASSLSPIRIELVDESEQHRGHAGHDPRGESHFALTIESASFTGQSRVQRQRAVYTALGGLMDDRVHALTIRAIAPGEN